MVRLRLRGTRRLRKGCSRICEPRHTQHVNRTTLEIAAIFRHMSPAGSPIRLRQDVAEALTWGRPVVALESTLIAHGLPRPDNLVLAREIEAIVREEGGVPATVGVIRGG